MADCQGGNGMPSAHAQSTCAKENGETQLSSIVNTLGKQLEVFGQTSQSIKTLAEAVAVLRTDMKQMKKRKSAEDDEPPRKKSKIISLGEHEERSDGGEETSQSRCGEESPWRASETQTQPAVDDLSSNDESEQENENDLSHFMKETQQPEECSDFIELEQYFQTVEAMGPAVNEQLARITDLALRGGDHKQDLTKLEEYKKEYKRPSNIENLQVPKVDDAIWRDLLPAVKTRDYLLQKTVTSYNLLLVPIIQALEALKTGGPDCKQTSQAKLMDAFKMLCLLVKTTNATRVEKLKKDIMPKYRGICNNTASATNLFGDNLQENLKKLEGSKISITTSRSFLGKRAATNHNPKPQNRTWQPKQKPTIKPHYNAQYNNNNAPYNNNNAQYHHSQAKQRKGHQGHRPTRR